MTTAASVAESTPSARPRIFSLAEIRSATKDFNPENVIGEGGFGKVYKAKIDDGQLTVAMKRGEQKSKHGEVQFLAEITTASKVQHVNLVSLIGYCNENGEMILVYEYIPNGSLADHLYRNREGWDSLTWKQLLNICIGGAQGILHLHTKTHPSIIHRDLKSTNILIDENFLAKVSDFGLAKHFSPTTSRSHVSTAVRGSYGYFDPSYFKTGKLTKHSDTYALGVVLLEALTGIPPTDTKVDGRGMVEWAKDNIGQGKADMIVALNLRIDIWSDCLKTFVGIAQRCLSHETRERPTMVEVVDHLELALRQQEGRATSLLFLQFRNWFMPSGNDNTPPANAVNAIPIYKLRGITNNFSSELVIRKAYGQSVYHGELSGKAAVIIMMHPRVQTDAEFLAQVSMVSSLKHANVAQLLGYCVDGDRHFIAYEFAVNGPLNDFFQGPERDLSWGQRIKIAMGVAQGLVYIHRKSNKHCNFGPNSVLVYDDNVAKLAYFYHPTRSTFDNVVDYVDYAAYVPPECKGELSLRSDIYGFGMILLQLVTGRNSVDARLLLPREDTNIMDWINNSVDARLHGDYTEEEVVKVAKTAVLCLKRAESRPSMSDVVRDLRPLLKH